MTKAIIVEITFPAVTIFDDLFVNGIDISALMIIVAGAHIGAVKISARPPPIAAAAIA